MSVIGVITDQKGRPVCSNEKYLCQVDLGDGKIENKFIDKSFLVIEGEGKDAQLSAGKNDIQIKEKIDANSAINIPNPDSDDDSLDSGGSGDSNDPSSNKEKVLWTDSMTKLLINSYREISLTKEFNTLLQKQIWQKISENLNEKGYTVTRSQCNNKWKGLLKVYKKHKGLINKTGSARRYWRYFDVIDEIMKNNPSISPVALASNLKGYVINHSERKRNISERENIHPSSSHNVQLSNSDAEDDCSSTEKKDYGKRESESKRLRHVLEKGLNAQLVLQEKFVNTFEEYVACFKNQKGEK